MSRKPPPMLIDLGLNDYYDGFVGLSPVNEKKRLKYTEQDHQKLHKRLIDHIHLDGSLHKIGGN